MKKIVLSILLVLLFIEPSFSQDFGSDYKVFQYTTFVNSGKTVQVLGAWSPSRKDDYVLCIKDNNRGQYFMLRDAEEGITWWTSLMEMKELFIRNDSIAKENNVTSDIRKIVTEQFPFKGLIFEDKWTKYRLDRLDDYGEWDYDFGTAYNYKNGQSSMEIYLCRYYKRESRLLWTFNSVEDFDSMMAAVNWTDFRNKVWELQSEYKKQQEAANAAAEKQKSESALFD